MTHCYNRIRHAAILLSLLALTLAATSTAQVIGTVTGTVTDSDGVPLPGAAVTIDGTRLGATTDADGHYFILQVPPGPQSITAQLIGFTPTTVENVRVSAGLTSRVDFRLYEEAIEVDAITVTAERPPIQRDITGSQLIFDADRMSEGPLVMTINVLGIQPGVSVGSDNTIWIRGGGPSEIRFQVDGLDRVDGLTSKSYAQLNPMLVSEIMIITGGFNAEYGNVRSGVVNISVKEGHERGGLLPWVAGTYNYTPSERSSRRGPGAYDEDQYFYRMLTKSDSALTGGPIFWPDLYEETRNDTAFMNRVAANPAVYRIFEGWNKRVELLNARRVGRNSAYGHNGWTVEDVIEAWQYETNMNEVAWQYGHEPSWGMSLAAGWALPAKMGGFVVGYTYNKTMTAMPSFDPKYRDISYEAKLTLTPTDRLKIQLMYNTASNWQPGTSAASSEERATGASTRFADPTASRGGDISGGKYNLSFLSGPLEGTFDQYGVSAMYTLGVNTFLTASVNWSKTTWDLDRDLPRAYMPDPSEWLDHTRYALSDAFGYPGLLAQHFNFEHGHSIPPSLDFATNPDSVIPNSPYGPPHIYREIPTETKFIAETFVWGPREFVPFRGDPVPDTTYTVTIVSPQGKVFTDYMDLSNLIRFGSSDNWGWLMDAATTQTVLRGDVTHVIGRHTLKSGVEYIGRELEFNWEGRVYFRNYGGAYPAARPKYLGLYVQNKYESDGMIANAGVRAERFDGGHPALLYNDLFNAEVFSPSNSVDIYRRLVVNSGWDTELWGSVRSPVSHFFATDDSLRKHFGVGAPLPSDIIRAWPQQDNKVHWRFSPRFGVSHPVSYRAKFFFNYGTFYSMQKPTNMYGYGSHNFRPGAMGRMDDLYNPNLRPGRTVMYEAGVESLLPFQAVLRAAAFAKSNTDQVSRIEVQGPSFKYYMYRNANYEDIYGYEITLTRSLGRFLNGSIRHSHESSRTGEVGYSVIADDPARFATRGMPWVRTSIPGSRSVSMTIVLGTPHDWGIWRGGWNLTTSFGYTSGGEVWYNPDGVPQRELSEDHRIPTRSTTSWPFKSGFGWSKSVRMASGSHVRVYGSVSNPFNEKRMGGGGSDYLSEIYYRRLAGEDVRPGDKSTWDWLERPWKSITSPNTWRPPMAPDNDWRSQNRKRSYSFGMTFEI